MVISKKVAKRSVDRHLLKRRVMEILRPWCSPTHSIIVFARSGSPTLTFRELSAEIAELMASTVGQIPRVR